MREAVFSSIVAMVISPATGSGGVEVVASGSRLAASAMTFGLVWAILTGGRGWGVGIPVILLATAASARTGRVSGGSITGLLRFLPYFAWSSLQSGVDVAFRALHPRLPIEPCLLRYEMKLASPAARILMANTVTLMPGTLSADLRGRILVVHVLDARSPATERLDLLERRVADLFGLDLGAAAP